VGPYITLWTLFDQTWIFLPQGCSILNINAWEEGFWRFINIFLILLLIEPQKGPAPLIEQIWISIPQECFLPSLVEIGIVVLEKKSFKGKSWRRTEGRRTTDAAQWYKLSWPSARWANKFIIKHCECITVLWLFLHQMYSRIYIVLFIRRAEDVHLSEL